MEECPSGRKVQHWKCCVGQPTAGSNPASSAKIVKPPVRVALQSQWFAGNYYLLITGKNSFYCKNGGIVYIEITRSFPVYINHTALL